MTTANYTRTAVALHWLVALLIIGGFAVGVTMVDLPLSPTKARVFAYHKWAGLTVLGLAAVRLAWRLTHPAPPDLPMPLWQARVARATHVLLYVLMFAVPVLGWLYTSAAGFPVVYFKLIQIPDLVAKDKELAELLKPVHGALAWSLAVLVALHVAAALKHHFLERDATLRRMLSWRRS